MRILIDTNVLLDYLLKREPFEAYARKIVLACKEGKLEGCIAAGLPTVGMCEGFLCRLYCDKEYG